VGEASDCAGWDYAYGTERVAVESAAFVVNNAGAGHEIGTATSDRTSWGRANIGKQTHAMPINGQQYACKTIARQAAAGRENCYCLTDIPAHTFY